MTYQLNAGVTYYIKVHRFSPQNYANGDYTIRVVSTDPFHISNIEYIRIKKYDQSQWNGDSDITTIVTKSSYNNSSYFEVYAPNRTEISFLITDTLTNELNKRIKMYLDHPTLNPAHVSFYLGKKTVDMLTESGIIDLNSPEYYGIWVYEANRLLEAAKYTAEQINLISAAVSGAYSTYKLITNYYFSYLHSKNNVTKVITAGDYSKIASEIDEINAGIGTNYSNEFIISSEERNSYLVTQGFKDPLPYKDDTPVVRFTNSSNNRYIRVYDEIHSQKTGRWFMKYSDIAGLTPSQIKDKFALGYEPKFYSYVDVPAGYEMYSGFVRSNYSNELGTALQFETVGLPNIPKTSYVGEFTTFPIQ